MIHLKLSQEIDTMLVVTSGIDIYVLNRKLSLIIQNTGFIVEEILILGQKLGVILQPVIKIMFLHQLRANSKTQIIILITSFGLQLQAVVQIRIQ